MSSLVNFYIGAKGTLILQRADGSIFKTGLRVRDGEFHILDMRTKEWVPIPATISCRSGPDIAVCIGSVHERCSDPRADGGEQPVLEH